MIDLDTRRKTRRVDLGTYNDKFAGVVLDLRELLFREVLVLKGLRPGDSEKEGTEDTVIGLLKSNILAIEGLECKGQPVLDSEKLLDVMTVSLGKAVVEALLGTSELSEDEAGN